MLASAAAATLFMVVSSGVDGAGASGDVSVDGTRAVGEASRWAVGDDSPGFVLGRARGRGDGRDVGDETVVAAAMIPAQETSKRPHCIIVQLYSIQV